MPLLGMVRAGRAWRAALQVRGIADDVHSAVLAVDSKRGIVLGRAGHAGVAWVLSLAREAACAAYTACAERDEGGSRRARAAHIAPSSAGPGILLRSRVVVAAGGAEGGEMGGDGDGTGPRLVRPGHGTSAAFPAQTHQGRSAFPLETELAARRLDSSENGTASRHERRQPERAARPDCRVR